MGKTVATIFICFAVITACNCIQWAAEPPENAVLYACAHGSLSLPWSLIVSPGDVIEDIKWFFSGRSEEVIAMETHGMFLPTPSFSGRVTKSTSAGLDMQRVQVLDSGNYSVEVLARTAAGDLVTLWRSAYVHVTDDLQTSDGELHVEQKPVAEYDNQTGEAHLVLTCGVFTYPTQPAFQATWQTPSGHSLPSSSYHNNRFTLLVPNPVEAGSYSCHVPSSRACIHGNSSSKASITVDKLEAHLVVMEASLGAKVTELKSKVTELEAKDAALETKINQLETGEAALKNQVDTMKQTVVFHAIALNTQDSLPYGSVVQFPIAMTNVGNAYNASTGLFTAPYNATYFFMASSEDDSTARIIHMGLMVDGSAELDREYSSTANVNIPVSVHGTARLTRGQKVWVRVLESNTYFQGYRTAFSGFLIQHTFY